MVDDFHVAILLNPKLTDDYIVHTTCGVCPGVGLIVSMEKTLRVSRELNSSYKAGRRLFTWAAPA